MRAGQNRVNWTPPEDEFLRMHGANTTRAVLSERLLVECGIERSKQAVKFRCSYLGIKSETTERDGVEIRMWSPKEDERLKALHDQFPLDVAARTMKRSMNSLKQRSKSIGISWKRHGFSIADAQRIVGVSRQTFVKLMKRAGIHPVAVSRCLTILTPEEVKSVQERLANERAGLVKIPRKPRTYKMETRPCAGCGKDISRPPFRMKGKKNVYCPICWATNRIGMGRKKKVRVPWPRKVTIPLLRERNLFVKFFLYMEKLSENGMHVSLSEVIRAVKSVRLDLASDKDKELVMEAAVKLGMGHEMRPFGQVLFLSKNVGRSSIDDFESSR